MIISTRVPPSITVFSQRLNSGTWKITIMSAAHTASSVPLHWPIVGHADRGPAGQRVDAELVDVGAERLGSGESGLNVLAPGAEIGNDGDRFARASRRRA